MAQTRTLPATAQGPFATRSGMHRPQSHPKRMYELCPWTPASRTQQAKRMGRRESRHPGRPPAPPRAASCQSLPTHPHPPRCARPRAGHSLRAPPCQHAFPHRGPCLPARPPRSRPAHEQARSVLDSCSVCCLSRLGPRGLPGENRPEHGNRGVVTVPPPAPGPGDKDDSPLVSSQGCWEATRPGQ